MHNIYLFVASLYCHFTHWHPDIFDILRNKCILHLNGESGDDLFTIRSFVSHLGNSLVDIDGGTGKNLLTIVGTEEANRYVIQDDAIFGTNETVVICSLLFGTHCSFY